ncbi:MAG: hypothetical protein ACPG77_07005, partial [Nannocystaceae bacterium]
MPPHGVVEKLGGLGHHALDLLVDVLQRVLVGLAAPWVAGLRLPAGVRPDLVLDSHLVASAVGAALAS